MITRKKLVRLPDGRHALEVQYPHTSAVGYHTPGKGDRVELHISWKLDRNGRVEAAEAVDVNMEPVPDSPWRKTVIDQLRQAEAERDEAVQRLETLKTSYAMESDAEPLNDRIDELEAKLTKARREASNLRAENASKQEVIEEQEGKIAELSETLNRQFVRTNIAEGIVYRMRKALEENESHGQQTKRHAAHGSIRGRPEGSPGCPVRGQD